MKLSRYFVTTLCISASFGVAGCSKNSPSSSVPSSQTPIVSEVKIKSLNNNLPTADPSAASSGSIQATLVVDRDSLLNEEFLFGADLQFSNYRASSNENFSQALSIGHIPAKFRIVRNHKNKAGELQLVALSKDSYQSDVNHPERVLSRYRIYDESVSKKTGKTALTISAADSSLILGEFFNGLVSSNSNVPKDHWVRSFEYVQEGNYLLQQSSIVLPNGAIAEFMESVFPRSTLAPGKDYVAIQMDASHPTGGESGLPARYRFIPSIPVFEQGVPIAYARHFDISSGENSAPKTIDYYVSKNIPDEFLEPVKLGVEGWNRYFKSQKGINRSVVKFKGRLPDGIHLGDPRYNVISWDNVTTGNSAYTSSSSDPSTGVISHNLIYLPASWVYNSKQYWAKGQFSEAPSKENSTIEILLSQAQNPKNISVAPKALKKLGGIAMVAQVNCITDMKAAADEMRSGEIPAEEMDVYSAQQIKQTLFHEIGHSLGLHHNFKGSLSYVPGKSLPSSVMDYNLFEVERAFFKGVHSANGPQLEYDRQIMSFLYNKGQDVLESDPVLPTCEDSEADTAPGEAVDPLCNRFDAGADPSRVLDHALQRATQDTVPGAVSLPEAIRNIGKQFTDPSISALLIEPKITFALMKAYVDAVEGSLNFYYLSGHFSVLQSLVINSKALLRFQDGAIPEDFNEGLMRSAVLQGYQDAIHMAHLPDTVTQAIHESAISVLSTFATSPAVTGLKASEQKEFIELLTKAVATIIPRFELSPREGLPFLRAVALVKMARHGSAPYYLGKLDGTHTTDIESLFIATLGKAALETGRTDLERVFAASALSSYRGRLTSGNQQIKDALKGATLERDLADTNSSRETAEKVVRALSGNASSGSESDEE